MTTPRRTWFAGPYPPPLSGQSNYNVSMARLLGAFAPVTLRGAGKSMAQKVARYAGVAIELALSARRGDVVYLSLPGQASTWLFLLPVAALRLRRIRHFVHHHSYRPINLAPSRPVALACRIGGRHQHHILLSPGMRDAFAAAYLGGDRARAHALSNALLFQRDGPVVARPDRPVTLGHLSVITREKGVDRLLDAFAILTRNDRHVRLVIGGPCDDPELRDVIDRAVAGSEGRITYLGPVTGAAKDAFYAAIDLYVLPSRLPDEAEPLVFFEAFAAGVDVAATDTGCIAERVRTPGHLLGRDDADDAARLATLIAELARDWSATRAAARAHGEAILSGAEAEGAELLATMMDVAPSPAWTARVAAAAAAVRAQRLG